MGAYGVWACYDPYFWRGRVSGGTKGKESHLMNCF